MLKIMHGWRHYAQNYAWVEALCSKLCMGGGIMLKIMPVNDHNTNILPCFNRFRKEDAQILHSLIHEPTVDVKVIP